MILSGYRPKCSLFTLSLVIISVKNNDYHILHKICSEQIQWEFKSALHFATSAVAAGAGIAFLVKLQNSNTSILHVSHFIFSKINEQT